MESGRLDRAHPEQLARLLALEDPIPWSGEDIRPILYHQLRAPLLPDLMLPGSDRSQLIALFSDRPASHSFLDELTRSAPSIKILECIKAFAQQVRTDVENPLHGTPATILYYAAIAAALARCHRRITSLTDEQLQEGFNWVLTQPIEISLKQIIETAFTQIPDQESSHD